MYSIFIKTNKSKKIYFEITRFIKISLLAFLIGLFLWSFIKLKFNMIQALPNHMTYVKQGGFSIFVLIYGVGFTDGIITLNFFINIAFLILLIIRPRKLGNKYNFGKTYNTVYALYLFTVYNLALVTSKDQIMDMINGHIALTSGIDHEITPIVGFIYCALDKNTLIRIDNKKILGKKIVKDTYRISLFALAFCIYDAIRNYLIYNHFGFAIKWRGQAAYGYMNYYAQGGKALGGQVLGAIILFGMCISLMLYQNRKYKYLTSLYCLMIFNSYKAIRKDPMIGFKKIKVITLNIYSKIKNLKFRKNINNKINNDYNDNKKEVV